MNSVRLSEQEVLDQDEWSLTSPKFGTHDQLKVLGHNGMKGNKRRYILECSCCKSDPDLFEQGYFSSSKVHLVNGRLPCGCSKNPQWNKDQYAELCKRKAEEIGLSFLGFTEKWVAQNTKIRMSCKNHGEYDTCTIARLINKSQGCPGCKIDKLPSIRLKSDEVMIESFLSTGAFHPDTKFWRSERLTSLGYKQYWIMYCPDCNDSGEAMSSDLRRGARPCACSKQRQQECYINWLITPRGEAVAIKFGVANKSEQRVKVQNRLSTYQIIQYAIYKFPSVSACKNAERECKSSLVCGIVRKEEMPDGYTETTNVCNLFKIIEIYERNGGTCIEELHPRPLWR